MTTWLEAHRLANIAAAQAHHDLGADTSRWRIDVTAAIARAGVVLMWRPLPLLFGAYVNEPGDRPGILINNQLSFAVGRHTAGHELGHHQFGHPTRYDGDLAVGEDAESGNGSLVVGAQSTRRNWPDVEKFAEAFASWFLMPRGSIRAGLALLGVARPRSEVDVYRLSVLLGVPYRTLVRHLLNVRLASSAQVRAWSSASPSRIKAGLDRQAAPPTSRRGAVWLTSHDWSGQAIPLKEMDRVVLPPGHTVSSELPGWLRIAAPRSADSTPTTVLEVTSAASPAEAELILTGPSDGAWQLHLDLEPAPSGLDLHWREREGSTA